ncbi:porin [Marinobacter sp.]|uniref:porin n=1 Tax=Marinobacter sp. TaxID=50741 RepID=UPI00384C975E
MKKTLIASAIAAMAFSGSALAMDAATERAIEAADARADVLAARMDSMPSVYGNIQYAITHDNFDNGPSSIEHFDNGTTLGVLHDHEIANGVTGFFKLELEGINADDKAASNGIDGLDEAYVGIRSEQFGQLWVGSDDSTYERAIVEIANYFEVGALNLGLGSGFTTGEGDLVQYSSPSFNGLTLGAAIQVNGDNDTKTKGEKSYPYQLAAIYEMDALTLAFAMDSNDGKGANDNTYGVRGSYTMDQLRLTAEYQTTDDKADLFGLAGFYTMGANTFALAYEYRENDFGNDLETDTLTAQALHNLSDNMYVYVEGYLGGGDDVYEYVDENGVVQATDERSIAAVGAVYYF